MVIFNSYVTHYQRICLKLLLCSSEQRYLELASNPGKTPKRALSMAGKAPVAGGLMGKQRTHGHYWAYPLVI